MNLLRTVAAAFSMYSAIPMPQFAWDEKTTRYLLCAFPLVGGVVGGAVWGWLWFCGRFQIGRVLLAAVATTIPVLITGGIHLDGFCDTVDALASHAPTEQKLQILKDAHLGAFALIGCCLYLLLTGGLWREFPGSSRACGMIGIGFVASRALSGLSVVTFRCAKTSGLAAGFADAAQKGRCAGFLLTIFWLCAYGMLWIQFQIGMACLLVLVAIFLFYQRTSYRQFGGITGDLAGWFLQLAEFGMLFAVIFAGRIVGWS